MPPPRLFDTSELDMTRVEATREQIYSILPHRHEFMQLDGIIFVDAERRIAVAYRDVREDEWWCKGHLPNRPLLPGVLIVESAAHLASYYFHRMTQSERFLGFAGIDRVKFREAVSPPARLLILGRAVDLKPRRLICDLQGWVEDTMVFEGRITGMPI